ncbi:MAG TPA: carbon-nitrogen hydrolase family protein [Opitutaceae bacterium]|nr:carbon-nitrogen hydrolase family protein [Opitutaceae bacterium]
MNAPSRPFRLALAQMTVVGGDRDRNLAHALRQIELAAQGGAEVVLLPEALDLGWTHPSSRQWAEPIPDGQRCQAIRAAARLHRIHVCAGLTERAGERVYNAAVLVSPAGEVILHHRKLNELAIAHDVYDQGDRLGVVVTPLGTFGLMICADGFARGHVVARTLGFMGADVILSPSAWAVPPDYDPVKRPYGLDWQENYATVAREFRLWVAGCSNVGRIDGGPWHGHDCIGCSCVVNPDGRTVAVAPYGAAAETILFTEVRPEPRPRAR